MLTTTQTCDCCCEQFEPQDDELHCPPCVHWIQEHSAENWAADDPRWQLPDPVEAMRVYNQTRIIESEPLSEYGAMRIVKQCECTVSGPDLVTDASTIELAPGEWPDVLAVEDEKGAVVFYKRVVRDHDVVKYVDLGSGKTLLIFND